eukprot:6209129-Pleurochrysis_carterae.AAC.3
MGQSSVRWKPLQKVEWGYRISAGSEWPLPDEFVIRASENRCWCPLAVAAAALRRVATLAGAAAATTSALSIAAQRAARCALGKTKRC